MPALRINLVSPWKIDCGVCAYGMFLAEELGKISDLKIFPVNKLGIRNPVYFVRLALAARKNCDVVNIQQEPEAFGRLWWMNAIYLPLFYVILSIPPRPRIVSTVHEPATEPKIKGLKGAIARAYIRLIDFFLVSFSDSFIALSRQSAGLLRSKGARSVAVIPHGSYARPRLIDAAKAKEIFGLRGKKVITAFGFINRRKDYLKIIGIMPELPVDVCFLVAGGIKDESYKREIDARIAQLGLGKRVVFSGIAKENDFPKIFAASDVVLFPYTDVMQSGALSVALAHRKAAVVSGIPGFREVYDEFKCVEIANTGEEWLVKIKKLLCNGNENKALMQGIEKYLAATNYAAIAKRVLAELEKV